MRDPRASTARRSRRQLVVGLLAIPLTILPFAAYARLTPEGRLLRDKAAMTLDPPRLPRLDAGDRRRMAQVVPRYHDAVLPLVYHGVGSSSSGEGRFSMSPDRFAEHLAALGAAGMRFVTAEHVADAFVGRRALPPRAVLLTFDDGRTDAMMWATPLLEQARARATMFVITGAADDPGMYYAGWNDLRRYDEGPWELQAHTAELHTEQRVAGGAGDEGDSETLPALTSLRPGESIEEYRARVTADLDTADAALEDHTGRRPVAFAYPFGAYGADRTNDRRIRQVLADEVRRRYALAFHQDGQDAARLATAADDRAGIRRLTVNGDWDGEELLERIAAAVRRTDLPGQATTVALPNLLDAIPPLAPPSGLDSALDVATSTSSSLSRSPVRVPTAASGPSQGRPATCGRPSAPVLAGIVSRPCLLRPVTGPQGRPTCTSRSPATPSGVSSASSSGSPPSDFTGYRQRASTRITAPRSICPNARRRRRAPSSRGGGAGAPSARPSLAPRACRRPPPGGPARPRGGRRRRAATRS